MSSSRETPQDGQNSQSNQSNNHRASIFSMFSININVERLAFQPPDLTAAERLVHSLTGHRVRFGQRDSNNEESEEHGASEHLTAESTTDQRDSSSNIVVSKTCQRESASNTAESTIQQRESGSHTAESTTDHTAESTTDQRESASNTVVFTTGQRESASNTAESTIHQRESASHTAQSTTDHTAESIADQKESASNTVESTTDQRESASNTAESTTDQRKGASNTAQSATDQRDNPINEKDNDVSNNDVASSPSCESKVKDAGVNRSAPLHDYPDDVRFPQGNVEKCIATDKYRPSWSFLIYSSKPQKNKKVTDVAVKKHYMQCLGMYVCPVEGCPCVANPIKPQTHKSSTRLPDKAKGDGLCPVHTRSLVHKPCSATAQLLVSENRDGSIGSSVLSHKGVHEHPRSQEKISQSARELQNR